jgi:hypothetical protein
MGPHPRVVAVGALDRYREGPEARGPGGLLRSSPFPGAVVVALAGPVAVGLLLDHHRHGEA